MLKVVFNRDGSIKTYELPTYVIKGSGGTISDSLKLEVAVEGLSLASGYLVNARFKLPNGTTNTLALLNDLDELSLYGNTYPNGKYGYLTTAQTYYEGVVKASLEITTVSDTNNVLFTFPFNIVVNPSTYDPDNTDELISNAQFKALELNYYNLFQSKADKSELGTKVWEEVSVDNFHDIKIGDAISGQGIVVSKNGENTINCLDLHEETTITMNTFYYQVEDDVPYVSSSSIDFDAMNDLGTKLYKHDIEIEFTEGDVLLLEGISNLGTVEIKCVIINNRQTPYTTEELHSVLSRWLPNNFSADIGINTPINNFRLTDIPYNDNYGTFVLTSVKGIVLWNCYAGYSDTSSVLNPTAFEEGLIEQTDPSTPVDSVEEL